MKKDKMNRLVMVTRHRVLLMIVTLVSSTMFMVLSASNAKTRVHLVYLTNADPQTKPKYLACIKF